MKGLLIFLIFSCYIGNIYSQEMEEPTRSSLADLEFTLVGGSISLYKRTVEKHSYGLSIGLFNYGYVLFSHQLDNKKPVNETRGIVEIGKIKIFYRYRVSKKVFLQTGLKYNYSMLGEYNCNPCYDGLFGLETSFVYKFGKRLGYKLDVSTVFSPINKDFYIYFNPLIICFNF